MIRRTTLVRVATTMAAATLLVGCGESAAKEEPTEKPKKEASASSKPTEDPDAKKAKLVAKAERLVLNELADIPLWEGTTAKGAYVSETEVCVDRTYRAGGGIDGKGGNAGYVVVTFPDGALGEPQDGTCAAATGASEPEQSKVEVPEGFKDDPGLVTREDLGDEWPLKVDFGALDCRNITIDGQELQSVTLRVPHMQYAVNGTAKTHSPFPDIDEIWADNPDVAGLKINMGPFTERGLARC